MSPEERKEKLEQELERILSVILAEYKPERVILFGSLATGKVHEWSDIDLVIIKNTDKQFLDRIEEVMLLVKPKLGCDVVVYTSDEYRQMIEEGNLFIREEIEREGKILYEAA